MLNYFAHDPCYKNVDNTLLTKDAAQCNTTDDVKNNNDASTQSNVESIEAETPAATHEIAKAKNSHGRLPHTAYTNITEHQLSHAEYKPGDICPMYCCAISRT